MYYVHFYYFFSLALGWSKLNEINSHKEKKNEYIGRHIFCQYSMNDTVRLCFVVLLSISIFSIFLIRMYVLFIIVVVCYLFLFFLLLSKYRNVYRIQAHTYVRVSYIKTVNSMTCYG